MTRLGHQNAAKANHLDPNQVQALAERIRRDYGHVDVLVNDIWGAERLKGEPAEWNTPIWEHDLDVGLRILRLAIDTHLVTSHHLLPLLIERPGGLLVEVTDGTTAYNASTYRISVYYDLAKVAVNRLGFSQGHELAPHGATALALTPGWLRSEMMLENFGVSEQNWRDALTQSITASRWHCSFTRSCWRPTKARLPSHRKTNMNVSVMKVSVASGPAFRRRSSCASKQPRCITG